MKKNEDRLKLKELILQGYKSFDSRPHKIQFNDVTIMIGANGAGKSNLVSFFKMLNYMMTGALNNFAARNDFDALMHLGSKVTPFIEAKLRFENNKVCDEYSFKLVFVSGRFIVLEEGFMYHQIDNPKPIIVSLPGLDGESGLMKASQKDPTSKVVYNLITRCRYFQFHDTSERSNIRNQTTKANNEYLYSDGGNLAAYLYSMKQSHKSLEHYNRIIKYIRSVMPQFDDFDLRENELNNDFLSLNWKQSGSEYVFSSNQISDGSLRFMALATLLLQSPERLPSVIVIDEPELGLHPEAISTLAAMVRIAAENSQVILATQSPTLLDEFTANEIVIVEKRGNSSEFVRKSELELAGWMAEYSLSELWEKNVLGGQP